MLVVELAGSHAVGHPPGPESRKRDLLRSPFEWKPRKSQPGHPRTGLGTGQERWMLTRTFGPAVDLPKRDTRLSLCLTLCGCQVWHTLKRNQSRSWGEGSHHVWSTGLHHQRSTHQQKTPHHIYYHIMSVSPLFFIQRTPIGPPGAKNPHPGKRNEGASRDSEHPRLGSTPEQPPTH